MSIAAINEQLLRAVGFGVALFDTKTNTLRFRNDVFEGWFPDIQEAAPLATVFPQVDIDEVLSAVEGAGRYTGEIQVKRKRRTLAIALVIARAEIGQESVLVAECQNVTRIRELEAMIESYSAMVERNTRDLQREKEKVEKLLLNIMPRAAYEEQKSFGTVTPQRFDNLSVLALDFTDFNAQADAMAPATFVGELNELYGAFDKIGDQFGCERIKTTGDSYLCVAGLHQSEDDHRQAVAHAAQRFVRFLNRRNENAETKWTARIGLGTGAAIGSVVGAQKYVYDLFGPAVNNAYSARLQAAAMEILMDPALAAALDSQVEMSAPADPTASAAGLKSLGTMASQSA